MFNTVLIYIPKKMFSVNRFLLFIFNPAYILQREIFSRALVLKTRETFSRQNSIKAQNGGGEAQGGHPFWPLYGVKF